MIKKTSIAFASVLILLSFYSCVKESSTLLEDMAFLDKQYMRALLVSKNLNGKNTEIALDEFLVFWREFKKKYYDINKEDRQWKTDFDAMQDILVRSKFYVKSGEDISASYLILHDGKYVLSDMRKRNNIEWFIDNLNSIYKTAYRINELSSFYAYAGVSGLTAEESTRIDTVFSLLSNASEKALVNLEKSNIALFNIPDAKLNSVIQNLEALNTIIIKDIALNIEANNYEQVAILSDNIMNLYFNILSMVIED